MKNIWYILGIIIFAIIVSIIAGVIFLIRKDKYYIFCELILIFCLIFFSVKSVPFIKDITKQETTIITAVYVKYQKDSVYPGSWRLILENDCETYKIISPVITKIHVKMEEGKTYTVEYYNNTKIIKKYTLIE